VTGSCSVENSPQSSLDFLQIMSNVQSRSVATEPARMCIRIHEDIQNEDIQTREQPTPREIILTWSHICAAMDGYESIKISHREPRIGRGNISNIRRADPSLTPHRLSITTLTSLLASYISFPRSLLACRLFALLLSRREKHFLSTAPARISRTRAVNFSFPPSYKRFSSFLFSLFL